VGINNICGGFTDVYDRETLVINELLKASDNSMHIRDASLKTYFTLLVHLRSFAVASTSEDLIYLISEMFELQRRQL